MDPSHPVTESQGQQVATSVLCLLDTCSHACVSSRVELKAE